MRRVLPTNRGGHATRCGLALWLIPFLGGCPMATCDPEDPTPESLLSHRVLVSVSVTGEGHVTSSPAGIDCPGDCAEEISAVDVRLHPSPEPGWRFAAWGGDCADSRYQDAFRTTSLGNIDCPAVFEQESAADGGPEDGAVDPGSDGGGSEADAGADGGADADGGGAPAVLTVHVARAGSVESDPPGIACGTARWEAAVNVSCGAAFDDGPVIVTGAPDVEFGLRESMWSGCDEIAGDACTVDMAGLDREVTVCFDDGSDAGRGICADLLP